MSDLACTKLLGYSKQYQIPKAIERYVSIFDFDLETLHAPFFYGGKFVEDLICPKKSWPDEDTYLAYVHTHLYNLGIYACLFYHLCCVGISEQHKPQEANNSPNDTLAHSIPTHLVEQKDRPLTMNLNRSIDHSPEKPIDRSNARGSYQQQSTTTKRILQIKRSFSLESDFVFGQVSKSREENKSHFFKRLGLTKQDVEIVEVIRLIRLQLYLKIFKYLKLLTPSSSSTFPHNPNLILRNFNSSQKFSILPKL